jgi:hypothetical protein
VPVDKFPPDALKTKDEIAVVELINPLALPE